MGQQFKCDDGVVKSRAGQTMCFDAFLRMYSHHLRIILVWLEVLTAVTMKMAVFWAVAPCRLIWVYKRFRGLYCYHPQSDERRGGRRSRPDDGNGTDLWNVHKLIPVYTALQPRRQPSSSIIILLMRLKEHPSRFPAVCPNEFRGTICRYTQTVSHPNPCLHPTHDQLISSPTTAPYNLHKKDGAVK
jgi:hypothetical protein